MIARQGKRGGEDRKTRYTERPIVSDRYIRETEKDRDRQTDIDIERQTGRGTETEIETHRQTGRQREKQGDTHTQRREQREQERHRETEFTQTVRGGKVSVGA